MRSRAATILWVVALVFILQLGAWPGSAHPDEIAGQEPRALLRLYGCIDALGAADPNEPRPDLVLSTTTDGAIDCPGDRATLPPAFIDSATDAFTRTALGARNQIIGMELRYLPTAWAPGPGTPPPTGTATSVPALADLTDPARGLFDTVGLADDGVTIERSADGRIQVARISDEAIDRDLDEDDDLDPVDFDPQDGVPDFHDAHVDLRGDADLYMPALETLYRYRWSSGGFDTVALPDNASFVFPFTSIEEGVPGLDGDRVLGARKAVHWRATPFGLGTKDDGFGALHTPLITLRVGDQVQFLDHALRVDRFEQTGSVTKVVTTILYTGGHTPEPIQGEIALTRDPADPNADATLTRPGARAENLVFADRLGIQRFLPDVLHPDPLQRDDESWFALVDSIDPAGAVTLRLGRFVSGATPHNAFAADAVLYHVPHLRERDGALLAFDLAQWSPVGSNVRLHAAGIDLRAWNLGDPLSMLPPFSSPHTHLHLLDPPLPRDPQGFVTSTDAKAISLNNLKLAPNLERWQDLAAKAPERLIRWETRGTETALHGAYLNGPDPNAFLLAHIQPNRYLALRLPNDRVLVDSVLLDETDAITEGSSFAASPRAHRTFVFDPRAPTPVTHAEGLLLAGATRVGAHTGDIAIPDPFLLRGSDHVGKIRVPDALADERAAIQFRFEPYGSWRGAAEGLLPRLSGAGGPQESAAAAGPGGLDRDHLWAARSAHERHTAAAGQYGPTLDVRMTFSFLSRGALEPLAAGLGDRTRILLPVASWRDAPQQRGLDSFDLDDDGVSDPLNLVGIYDLSAGELVSAPASAQFTGNASAADLLWVRSEPLALTRGEEVRLWDVGYRLVTLEADGAATWAVQDLAGMEPVLVSGSFRLQQGAGRDCLGIPFDRSLAPRPLVCDDVRAAAPGAGPTSNDIEAWVELIDTTATSATVRVHRLLTTVDRAPAGDQRAILVDGAMYRVARIGVAAPAAGEGAAFAGLVLQHRIPIGWDPLVERGRGHVALEGLQPVGTVPMAPPFGAAGARLLENRIPLERDRYGFVDSLAEPDADVGRGDHRDRVWGDTAGLAVTLLGHHALGRAVLAFDPFEGPGIRPHLARVGIHQDPGGGLKERPAGLTPFVALREGGSPENLRSVDDRGWDHVLEVRFGADERPVRIDGARLGAPIRTARLLDAAGADHCAINIPCPSARSSIDAGPNERGSGVWWHDPAAPYDLYVSTLAVGSTPGGPVEVPPPGGPAGSAPEGPGPGPGPHDGDGPPSIAGDPPEEPVVDRGSPGLGLMMALLALFAMAIVRRRAS